MFGIGPMEMLVVGFIAVLLFGKRLPEVARSLGKGVTEFKKGIKGLDDDVADVPQHRELPHATDVQAPRAPKFEPPTSPPTDAGPSSEQASVRAEPAPPPSPPTL